MIVEWLLPSASNLCSVICKVGVFALRILVVCQLLCLCFWFRTDFYRLLSLFVVPLMIFETRVSTWIYATNLLTDVELFGLNGRSSSCIFLLMIKTSSFGGVRTSKYCFVDIFHLLH